jgi:endonuclease/exonuclease/phosphatase family metal-dependent hydrolase
MRASVQSNSSSSSSNSNSNSIHADSFFTLGLWNTHLEVNDEVIRFNSFQCIADKMDTMANRSSIREPRGYPIPCSSQSSESGLSCSRGTWDQLLVGDLNAMSRFDYTPAERQYQSRVDRFHFGIALAHTTDPWRCMEFLEDEQKWVDAFTKAGVERPKISVWSCRRVDHALLYRGCTWSVKHCFQIFTKASDHLPIFIVLQPPQQVTLIHQ